MSTIDLPLPPSVNSIWRSARGRVFKSKRYTDWQRSAGWQLKQQRPRKIPGQVAVSIAAGKPDRRRRDIDNLGKAVLDLLVAHQIISDDALVQSLTASWDDAIIAGRIVVTLAAIN